jgi:hypothetical protein
MWITSGYYAPPYGRGFRGINRGKVVVYMGEKWYMKKKIKKM